MPMPLNGARTEPGVNRTHQTGDIPTLLTASQLEGTHMPPPPSKAPNGPHYILTGTQRASMVPARLTALTAHPWLTVAE